MTAYRLQTEPAVRRTRELIREGTIGEVVQIQGGFSHPLLEYTSPDTWRLDPDLAGGGALVDLGVYPLNTIRFLLDCDPTGVYATTYSSGGPFAAVDEHVAFQLEFPTEVTASCTASFDAHAHSRLEIIGTDGIILIASPFGGVVPQEMVVESGDMRMEYTGPPVDEVCEEFDYFGYCVLTGTEPEPDGRDGSSICTPSKPPTSPPRRDGASNWHSSEPSRATCPQSGSPGRPRVDWERGERLSARTGKRRR